MRKRGLRPGDRVRFDNKNTVCRVRANALKERYAILTCAIFGKVYYTIVDQERGIRGAMNIMGYGLGIFTTSSPDQHIDKAVKRLEDPRGEWRISDRNRVKTVVTWFQREQVKQISIPAAVSSGT